MSTFTYDSFGAGPVPENWEKVCEYLNAYAESLVNLSPDNTEQDINDIYADVWERFCAGKLDECPDLVFAEE